MTTALANLTPGTPTRADGLCRHCGKPHLYDITLHHITRLGVSPIATIRLCQNCGNATDTPPRPC